MHGSESTLYRISVRPSTILGLLASLMVGRAGDGAAIGNDWYHFRRGSGFVRDDLRIAGRSGACDILPVRAATEEDRAYLESLIGTPWRWWCNCFCVTRGLWHEQ